MLAVNHLEDVIISSVIYSALTNRALFLFTILETVFYTRSSFTLLVLIIRSDIHDNLGLSWHGNFRRFFNYFLISLNYCFLLSMNQILWFLQIAYI